MRLKSFLGAHHCRFATCPRNAVRTGFTLFEVVIALAIFLLSLTAITELLTLSARNATTASLETQGVFLCQSKMAEVLAGYQTLSSSSTGYAPFNDPSGTMADKWQWRMQCDQSNDTNGLWTVQVWVKMDRGGETYEYSLSQMVYTPSQRGSTLDPPPSASSSSGGSQ